MRRLAPIALVAALACGEALQLDPGPRDRFYLPTGLAVWSRTPGGAGELLVASSNSDLRYDAATGGTVIAVDPLPDPTPPALGAVNLRSFTGELAIADAARCPEIRDAQSLALVPVRGANLLYPIRIGADGSLSCEGCEISLSSGEFADPYAVGVACGGGIARAYVGYLRSTLGGVWITQIDLAADPADPRAVQHAAFDAGQARSFAYDPDLQRLYVVRTLTGQSRPTLRWIDLGGCEFDQKVQDGGCRSGVSAAAALGEGVELRAIALSNSSAPLRRAYLTARVFDPSSVPRVDYDGLLVVADLAEDAFGQLDLRVVRQIPIGLGVSDVRVLPARPGKRDAVVALGGDQVWIYDDDTGKLATIGRDENSGRPILGRVPFSLAVDPVPTGGNAHVYVGSFEESVVSVIEVPLADPQSAPLLTVNNPPRRIGGAP